MGVRSSKDLSKDEVDSLQQSTLYGEEELRKLWKECEGHKNHSHLKKATILSILRRQYGVKQKDPGDDEIAERICALLDVDGNGSIDFKEFVIGMNTLMKGEHRNKLEFMFRMYDLDNNGVISVAEFTRMINIVASSRLAQKLLMIRLELNETLSIEDWIDKEFKKADRNQDGVVTLSEYMNHVTEVIETSKIYDEPESASTPRHRSLVVQDTPHKDQTKAFKVIVVGPKNSGKDRVAEAIASTLGLPHISTVGILQDEAEKGTNLGLRCQFHLNQKSEVPDDIVSSVLESNLERTGDSWVLDGFPFTEGQVLYMNQTGWIPDQIILLSPPKSENGETVVDNSKVTTCLKRMYDNIIYKVDSNAPFGDIIHESIVLLENLQKKEKERRESDF